MMNNVAQFIRFHNEEKLAKDEKLLRIENDYYRIKILPDSFLFQEGHARHYQDAGYGVFKFDNSVNYLLVGLADKDRKIITIPEPINEQE